MYGSSKLRRGTVEYFFLRHVETSIYECGNSLFMDTLDSHLSLYLGKLYFDNPNTFVGAL